MDVFDLTRNTLDRRFLRQVNTCVQCESDYAENTITTWQQQGYYVAGVTGTFDLLTLNHAFSLIQDRVLASAYALELTNQENLTESECDQIWRFASSNQLKLLVSIDTNQATAQSKSGQAEKASIKRPILDWENRARLVSLIAMPSYQRNEPARFVADNVTAHGKGACKIHTDCLVQQPDYEIFMLKPDVTIIKDRYDKGKQLRHYQLPNIVTFSETHDPYSDALLGDTISTTNIVRSILNSK